MDPSYTLDLQVQKRMGRLQLYFNALNSKVASCSKRYSLKHCSSLTSTGRRATDRSKCVKGSLKIREVNNVKSINGFANDVNVSEIKM